MKIFCKTEAIISVFKPFQTTRSDECYSGDQILSAYKEHLSTFELSTVCFVWLFLGAAKWTFSP
jgi:hypothetical protein